MSFVGRFFLLVLVLGFGELYLLIKVASTVGFLWTLALCVLTGVVGGALVRAQGLRTWGQIQQSLARGEMPAVEIVSGLVLLIVGVLLLMPGFITDAVGFLLLVPQLRAAAARRLARSFEGRGAGLADPGSPPPDRAGKGRIIDVEAE